MRKITALTGWSSETLGKDVSLPFIGSGDIPAFTLEKDVSFGRDEEGKEIYLHLASLTGRIKASFDGEPAAEHPGSSSDIYIRLTGSAVRDKNCRISLKIDPSKRADGKFVIGAAEMISVPSSHFTLGLPGRNSVSVTPLEADGEAVISVETEITHPNNYDVVTYTVISPSGEESVSVTAKPTAPSVRIEIPSPVFWSGPFEGNMYKLRCSLSRDKIILDEVTEDFGLVRKSVTDTFRLGQLAMPLNCAVLGDCSKVRTDLGLFEKIDANLLIFTSLPAKTDLLSLCDNKGWLSGYYPPYTGKDGDFEELKSFLSANRNHPSLTIALCDGKADAEYAAKFSGTVRENAPGVFAAFSASLSGDTLALQPGAGLAVISVTPSVPGSFTAERNTLCKIMLERPSLRFLLEPDFDPDDTGLLTVFWATFSGIRGLIGFVPAPIGDIPGKKGLSDVTRILRTNEFHFFKTQYTGEEYMFIPDGNYDTNTQKYTGITCFSSKYEPKITVNGKSKKKYAPVVLCDRVYRFEKIKLKKKPNTIVVGAGDIKQTVTVNRLKKRGKSE